MQGTLMYSTIQCHTLHKKVNLFGLLLSVHLRSGYTSVSLPTAFAEFTANANFHIVVAQFQFSRVHNLQHNICRQHLLCVIHPIIINLMQAASTKTMHIVQALAACHSVLQIVRSFLHVWIGQAGPVTIWR